jgi:hypothetical protein
MELTYDWRSFQSMFYPRKRGPIVHDSLPTGPVYVVAEQDVIITAFGGHEDLSEWTGGSCKEMTARLTNRNVAVFQRNEVESWMNEAVGLSHFYEQVEFFRAKAETAVRAKIECPRHFLIEALKGWWNRILPSAYGVFIRVEGQPDQDILLLVRRGVFEGFHRPDLSLLTGERSRQTGEIIKHLSETYLVPVQGMFVTANDWAEWSMDASPWRQIAKAVSANRAKLVPFRWGPAFLMSIRAFFGI